MSRRTSLTRSLFSCLLHFAGSPFDRFDDIYISRAAAKIALESMFDLFVGRVRIGFQEMDCGHDDARRAIAALQTMFLAKSFLHWMKAIAVCQSFDGLDVGAIGLNRENSAGFHGSPVEMNGTSAALARVAADMRPG